MTLTELRYVLAVAQTSHFGNAAKLCHVSQPTLSIAIQKLEENLGVAIFERHRKDVKITPIGMKIVNKAQQVMQEVTSIKEIAQTGKSQINAPLKIGVIHTVAPYLLPNLIPQLKKIAPQMPLWIHEDFTAHLREKLQQGELDVIFISLPFREREVVIKAVYEEPLLVLMHKDHPLSKNKNISPQELAQQNVLLMGEGHCFRDQVLEICPDCYRSENFQKIVEGSSLNITSYGCFRFRNNCFTW